MPGITLAAVAVIVAVSVALTIWPVRLAAQAVGARTPGWLRCTVALVVANVLHGVGLAAPVLGALVAFLLSAVAFAVLLGTGYGRALVIAVLQMVLTYLIGFAIAVFFGGVLGIALWGAAAA